MYLPNHCKYLPPGDRQTAGRRWETDHVGFELKIEYLLFSGWKKKKSRNKIHGGQIVIITVI